MPSVPDRWRRYQRWQRSQRRLSAAGGPLVHLRAEGPAAGFFRAAQLAWAPPGPHRPIRAGAGSRAGSVTWTLPAAPTASPVAAPTSPAPTLCTDDRAALRRAVGCRCNGWSGCAGGGRGCSGGRARAGSGDSGGDSFVEQCSCGDEHWSILRATQPAIDHLALARRGCSWNFLAKRSRWLRLRRCRYDTHAVATKQARPFCEGRA